MIDYTTKKNWDSLSSLNSKIVSDYESKKTKEKVVLYDGIQVITNMFIYSLFDGELTKEKAKPKPKAKPKAKAKPKK